MKQLLELKERLCEELVAFSGRDLNTSNLEMIDKLAHATKNLGKIIEMKEEEEYSSRGSYGMSNRGSYGGSYEGSYEDGSFARGRGRNARRDSMGRYSRDGYSRDEEVIHEMRSIMNSLPSNKREDMERIIMKMEQM